MTNYAETKNKTKQKTPPKSRKQPPRPQAKHQMTGKMTKPPHVSDFPRAVMKAYMPFTKLHGREEGVI